MNGLSEFDGTRRARQICDLRIRGKSEPEVCQMLGVTVEGTNRVSPRKALVACDVGGHTSPPNWTLDNVEGAGGDEIAGVVARWGAGAYSPSPSLPDVRT